MDHCRARPARFAVLVGIVLWLALSLPAITAAASTPEPASPWHHVDAAGAPVVDLWFGCSIAEARRLKLLSGLLMIGVSGLLLFAPDRLSEIGLTIGLFATAISLWLVILFVERSHRPVPR